MKVFDDLDSLSQAAASEFVRLAGEAITKRGRFVVALSGGSTPKRLFGLLAGPPYVDEIDWSKVFAVFGDERFVPPTDAQSNEKMARESLLGKVAIPEENIFAMYSEGTPAEAAERYETRMRDLLGPDLTIDLVLLGIGPDGHTASLFPGDPSVHVQDRIVVASVASANARDRITMTPVLINKASEVLFLVAGADKADPLKRMTEGPIDFEQTPSQAIGRFAPNVLIFADRAAAGA